MIRKVYIAGPDVFAPNANELGQSYKNICNKYGFHGVYPLDGKPGHSAREIFLSNRARIRDADFVVANINRFRGDCMDDGTAWEIGYAVALNKHVYCYTSDGRSLRERIGERDSNDWNVEDFSKPVNLMISESVKRIVIGDFEDCIRALAECYGTY